MKNYKNTLLSLSKEARKRAQRYSVKSGVTILSDGFGTTITNKLIQFLLYIFRCLALIGWGAPTGKPPRGGRG